MRIVPRRLHPHSPARIDWFALCFIHRYSSPGSLLWADFYKSWKNPISGGNREYSKWLVTVWNQVVACLHRVRRAGPYRRENLPPPVPTPHGLQFIQGVTSTNARLQFGVGFSQQISPSERLCPHTDRSQRVGRQRSLLWEDMIECWPIYGNLCVHPALPYMPLQIPLPLFHFFDHRALPSVWKSGHTDRLDRWCPVLNVGADVKTRPSWFRIDTIETIRFQSGGSATCPLGILPHIEGVKWKLVAFSVCSFLLTAQWWALLPV